MKRPAVEITTASRQRDMLSTHSVYAITRALDVVYQKIGKYLLASVPPPLLAGHK
jgi:hypothetical protein